MLRASFLLAIGIVLPVATARACPPTEGHSELVLPAHAQTAPVPVPRNVRFRLVGPDHLLSEVELRDSAGQLVPLIVSPVPEAPGVSSARLVTPSAPLVAGESYQLATGDRVFQVVATEVTDLEPPAPPRPADATTRYEHVEERVCAFPGGWFGIRPLVERAAAEEVVFSIHADGELLATNVRGAVLTAEFACQGSGIAGAGLRLDEGHHDLVIRTVDTAGNVSEPVALSVDLECAIPVQQYLGCSTSSAGPAGAGLILLLAAMARRAKPVSCPHSPRRGSHRTRA